MEQGLDLSTFIVDCTLQALCDLGILVRLDGDVGYNGITIPQGVSTQYLEDAISDLFNSHFEEIAKDMAGDIVGESFNG